MTSAVTKAEAYTRQLQTQKAELRFQPMPVTLDPNQALSLLPVRPNPV